MDVKRHQLADLEDAIYAIVQRRPIRFAKLKVELTSSVSSWQKSASIVDFHDRHRFQRQVDRTLQRLRRAGRIRYQDNTWMVVEPNQLELQLQDDVAAR